jgi:hypothetical protein
MKTSRGFYHIRYGADDSIFIEVETRKKTVEIHTTRATYKDDVYNSGLSGCRVEELVRAIGLSSSSGSFTSFKR